MKNKILINTLSILNAVPLTLSAANIGNLKRVALKDMLNSMQAPCTESSFQEKLSQQKLIKNFRSALRWQNQKVLTQAIENILAFTLITQEQLDIVLLKEITTAAREDQSKEWATFLQTKLGRSASPTAPEEQKA